MYCPYKNIVYFLETINICISRILISWNEFFLLFRGFEIHFAATNLFRGKERKKKIFLISYRTEFIDNNEI